MKRNPLSFQINVEKFSFASDAEKKSTNLMRPNSTFFVDGLKRFVKNPVAMVSFCFIVILLIMVFIVPLFYPYAYDEVVCYRYVDRADGGFLRLAPFEYAPLEKEAMANGVYVPPHLFGTDSNGHDYFIRILVGARTSLIVGFFAAIIVLIIGGTIGALSGYIGGKFDLFVMRVVDIIYSLPDILIIILLSATLAAVFDTNGDNPLAKLGSGFIAIFIVFALRTRKTARFRAQAGHDHEPGYNDREQLIHHPHRFPPASCKCGTSRTCPCSTPSYSPWRRSWSRKPGASPNRPPRRRSR